MKQLSNRWKVVLAPSIFPDDEMIVRVTAESEEEACNVAIDEVLNKYPDLFPRRASVDIWYIKRIPPGGKRAGAGAPKGRKTKPIRVPLEYAEDLPNKLDRLVDRLKEWKLISHDSTSPRFWFLKQLIHELEEDWDLDN